MAAMSLKMAKASRQDIEAAMELVQLLDALEDGDFSGSDTEAIERIRALRERGSLMRVVWGLSVLLNPANAFVNPDSDVIEHHPDRLSAMPLPFSEWTCARGPALWWGAPISWLPFVGSPGDSDWPWSEADESRLCWIPIPNLRSDRPASMPADGGGS